jgi:LacI family repressor for deo operon, udp, cdd, tsx, nupC, and nupG
VRIKITDVAARARVSPITASRALSNPGLVSVKTRARVLKAAEELGYVPNRLARGLRNGKTQTIAIITTDLRQRLNTLKLALLQRDIVRHGYHTLLLIWDKDERERVQSLLSVCRGVVDGIVLCYLEGGPSLKDVESLRAAGIPVVSIEPFPCPGVDIVTADREYGARLATEHLLRLGHTRIALGLIGTESEVAERRISGYRQAMTAAGHEPQVVSRSAGTGSLYDEGYNLILESYRADVRPTAWVLPDDEVAVGAMRALHELGQLVPEDVAIIGWDNLPLCDYVRPRLTSVTQPVEEIVHGALERLLAQIGGESPVAEVSLVQPELVIRESCGSPPNMRTASPISLEQAVIHRRSSERGDASLNN